MTVIVASVEPLGEAGPPWRFVGLGVGGAGRFSMELPFETLA
jgi:hypothetical protein